MVDDIEARFYVALYEPDHARPLFLDFPHRTVTGFGTPETVTAIGEVRAVRRVVDRFQDYSYYLLYNLVPGTGYTQSPEFPVCLWDERLTNGPASVALVSH